MFKYYVTVFQKVNALKVNVFYPKCLLDIFEPREILNNGLRCSSDIFKLKSHQNSNTLVFQWSSTGTIYIVL